MPFRFYRRIGLGHGLRLNLSRSGVSVSGSAGPFTVTGSKRGWRATASAHGTGMSVYRTGKWNSVPRPRMQHVHWGMCGALLLLYAVLVFGVIVGGMR